MKNIFIPLAFFAAIIFFACRPEPLIITLPEEPQQVVVFSQLIPGQVITVLLTKTISSLAFSEEEGDSLTSDFVDNLLVDSAEVTITFEGETEELVQLAPGVYASINTPQRAGVEYLLEITTREGVKLTSRSTMLERVGFQNVTPIIKRTAEDTLVTLEYDFIDPPGDNWYMINYYRRARVDTTTFDLNNILSAQTGIATRTILLTDKIFDNNNPSDLIDMPDVSPTDSIVVTISNINEQYHQFLDLRRRSGNFLTTLTKEPISYPTNIEGGLGFFNTHFPDVKVFDLNDY